MTQLPVTWVNDRTILVAWICLWVAASVLSAAVWLCEIAECHSIVWVRWWDHWQWCSLTFVMILDSSCIRWYPWLLERTRIRLLSLSWIDEGLLIVPLNYSPLYPGHTVSTLFARPLSGLNRLNVPHWLTGFPLLKWSCMRWRCAADSRPKYIRKLTLLFDVAVRGGALYSLVSGNV